MSALEDLVRAAMCSGAVCIIEKASRGEVDLRAPLVDSLGDFPAEFLQIRPALADDLRREWGVVHADHPDDYSPLYAEKRCIHCGYWRGEHIGASINNAEMACPPSSTFAPAPEAWT